MTIAFTVYGDPQSQGSMRAFMPRGWKRPVLTSTNKKLKPWRQEVAASALCEMSRIGMEMIERPHAVEIRAVFYFQRPKSDKKKRLSLKTTAPDIDKLARGLADAMTGIAYVDDAQISSIHYQKLVDETPRTEIEVRHVCCDKNLNGSGK